MEWPAHLPLVRGGGVSYCVGHRKELRSQVRVSIKNIILQYYNAK